MRRGRMQTGRTNLEDSMTSNTEVPGLLTGLTYTVPLAGVIRTGYIVTRQGKRLPYGDDE